MVGIRHAGAVVRLAASHSASEAFVAAMLARLNAQRAARRRARDRQLAGRARAGRRRPRRPRRRRLAARATPNPGVRETELVDDAIVCAVPPGHPWAARARSTAGASSRRRWSCATRRRTRAGRSTPCSPRATCTPPSRWSRPRRRAPRSPRPAAPRARAPQPPRHRPDRLPSSRSTASPSRAATCSSPRPTASRPARSASSSSASTSYIRIWLR